MVDLYFTLHGQIGRKRAEVRLEPGQLRVQALSVVTQQPEIDASFSIREITELVLLRRTQWTFVLTPAVLVALVLAGRWDSIMSLDGLSVAVFFLILISAFWLVAWLLPRNSLRIASQDAHVEVDVSIFARRRARQLIDLVLRERPDLRASASGPTRA
jgi:hypothetical protein